VTMGFVAQICRGTQKISLNASPFTIGSDFVPPSVAETPGIANGRGKARRVGSVMATQSISITVHVQGTSVEYIRQQVDLLNSFLQHAGDRNNPVYLEWRPDNLISSSQVIFGQSGAYRRVQILWGELQYGDEYGLWDHSVIIPDCRLNLLVGPYIEGERQRLAEAKGGISEDWVGTESGRSRGLRIPDAKINYISNPIFSNLIWNYGWTAGSGATVSRNTTPSFVVFGAASARIASSSSSTGTYTQSINVGDTSSYVLSCYAILPSKAAITSSHAQLYYNGAALTTVYTEIGGGIYRLSATLTGQVGSVTYGILVKSQVVLYVDGFQLESGTLITPLMCGDFLGHSWASLPMGSSSIREEPYVRLPVDGLIDRQEFSIRVIWKADWASSAYTKNGWIFKSSSIANFHLGFNYSSDTWAFMNDNTTAATFSAGDIIVFHVTCNSTELKLYVNGTLAKTVAQSGYLTPTSGYLYIGSDDTPDYYMNGLFMDFQIYSGTLTSTEISSDYANILPLVQAEMCPSPIPYVWTKDGDSIVDYTYAAAGIYSNIAVIGGVAGSLPAEIDFKAVTAGMNNADVFIGRLDVEYQKFIDPEFLTYEGSPDAKTITTSATNIASIGIDDDEFSILAGRQIAVMVRGDEDGADNIHLSLKINLGGAAYSSEYVASDWIASGSNVSNFLTPSLEMLEEDEMHRILGISRDAKVQVQGKRTTGSDVFNLHTAQIMPFPLIRLVNISASGIATTILYMGGKAMELNDSTIWYGYSVRGDVDEFNILPGVYNILISYIGAEGVATDTGDTLTYSAFYVTPRWSAL